MKKSISLLLIIFMMICSLKGNSNGNDQIKGFQITTFSNIPKDIDGGSCCFYRSLKDKTRHHYVMVNNLADLAYVSINKKVIIFNLIKEQKGKHFVYRNKDYNLNIDIIKEIQDPKSDESYSIIGYMSISDSHGNHQKIKIYGDCCW